MQNSDIIKKLKKREPLTYSEIKKEVDDYVNDKLSDEEMTTFLKLICRNKLCFRETLDLTDIMLKSGESINLKQVEKNIVDKHSTGGIGDKVSLIVGPIVASLGLAMPKMSGRGLGITGGTIDKLKSIPGYDVNISKNKFINILNEVGVSIIAQNANIVPADKKIYALRNSIGLVNDNALIASSIMSKKIACSADVIVIDMKVGKGAFMKNMIDATKLSRIMTKIANAYNKKLICVLTDMNEPLGYNIGNALEVQEAIEFFNGVRDEKLEKVVTTISAYLVSYGKMIPLKQAKMQVLNTLENGRAKNKFYAWIKAQNGKIDKLNIKADVKEIYSKKEGYIKEIDAFKVGTLVKDLGAGRENKEDKIDYNVGVILNKKTGDRIKENELIATVYYNKRVKNMEEKLIDCFDIKPSKEKKKDIILKIIK